MKWWHHVALAVFAGALIFLLTWGRVYESVATIFATGIVGIVTAVVTQRQADKKEEAKAKREAEAEAARHMRETAERDRELAFAAKWEHYLELIDAGSAAVVILQNELNWRTSIPKEFTEYERLVARLTSIGSADAAGMCRIHLSFLKNAVTTILNEQALDRMNDWHIRKLKFELMRRSEEIWTNVLITLRGELKVRTGEAPSLDIQKLDLTAIAWSPR